MIRWAGIILTALVTSFFLFPFNLPLTGIEVNTKMILAVVGAVLLVNDKVRGKGPQLSRDFVILCVICAIISVWAFGVSVINNTSDRSFALYLVSVWVWLGAAYAVVSMISWVHGEATVERIGNYLIAVCTVQCLLAYFMTVWPSLGSFVDSLMGEGEAFMSATENRMHGLGAALDPAGLRFSAVLVILSYLMAGTDFDTRPWQGMLYMAAFCIITVIGNMIARTTTAGAILAIVLFGVLKSPRDGMLKFDRSWGIIVVSILLVTFMSVALYRINPAFRSNLRFGFEGFFSLAEKGRWEVRSNDILKGMVVWPETAWTWLVGDGFFDSPKDMPNRFGQVYGGYYKRTDIGYLRYIFYFGSIGLAGLLAAFGQMTHTCIRRLGGYRPLFLMLLLVNLLGWLKVSSDIIMVFAPFLVLAYQKEMKCTSSTA